MTDGRIQAALDEFMRKRAMIGGCSDHGCRIIRPSEVAQGSTMGTNGGCHCHYNKIKVQHFFHATDDLVKALKAIDGAG